jgi:ABC-type nitrate/sulfonate/bicarbonate transport system permease component
MLLIVWHLGAAGEGVVIPSIGSVAEVLAHPFREPPYLDSLPLADSLLVSILRVLLGFGAALATALPLGIWAGRSRTARELLLPSVELGRPISPVAWMPLAIILLGFSSLGSMLYGQEAWRHDILDQLQLAIVAVIWWGAFFPIFLNTMHSVGHVRQLHLDAAQTLGASRGQTLRHVILPASLPTMMVGIRLGMGRALMVIVAAEFFPGTRSGLGYLITSAHQAAQYEYAFASIVVVAGLGLAINLGLFWVESRVGRWQVRER